MVWAALKTRWSARAYGACELAEQGGYILVTPMGYNCGGWYGIPVGAPRGGGAGAGRGAGAPGAGAPPAARSSGRSAARRRSPGCRSPARSRRTRGRRCVGGGTAVTDAAKVRELSEKETMHVLDLIRKEFNVDERRIYLMGHSMGGAGTYYLASKYPEIWAAIGPVAPAAWA